MIELVEKQKDFSFTEEKPNLNSRIFLSNKDVQKYAKISLKNGFEGS